LSLLIPASNFTIGCTPLRESKEEEGFAIPYSFMTTGELKLIGDIFKNRQKLFYSLQSTYQENWCFSGYKHPLARTALWPMEKRRAFIRDFVFYVLSRQKVSWLSEMKDSLITVTLRLIECDQRRSDDFVRNLHDKLQGIGNINNLMTIYE